MMQHSQRCHHGKPTGTAQAGRRRTDPKQPQPEPAETGTTAARTTAALTWSNPMARKPEQQPPKPPNEDENEAFTEIMDKRGQAQQVPQPPKPGSQQPGQQR